MMAGRHNTEAVYNRYDIADHRDLELAADKLHEYHEKVETRIGIDPNEGSTVEGDSKVKMARLTLADAVKPLTGQIAAGFSSDSVACLNVGTIKINRPGEKNR